MKYPIKYTEIESTKYILNLENREDCAILFQEIIELLLQNNKELVIEKQSADNLINKYTIEIEVSAPNQKGILRLVELEKVANSADSTPKTEAISPKTIDSISD